jgi:hypothetical protein
MTANPDLKSVLETASNPDFLKNLSPEIKNGFPITNLILIRTLIF